MPAPGPRPAVPRDPGTSYGMGLLTDAAAHEQLQFEAAGLEALHLSTLLADDARSAACTASAFGGDVVLDYSRQKLSLGTLELLEQLYNQRGVGESLRACQAGGMQNLSEQRSVLHTALRAARSEEICDKDGVNVVPAVYGVLDRIASFSAAVRSGEWCGATGAPLTNVVVIGIGGSYLGPEFVCEALRYHAPSADAARGRTLRFLANVDPSDFHRATADLDPGCTLVVVVSKTFTTAETMLNALTVRRWLWCVYSAAAACVRACVRHIHHLHTRRRCPNLKLRPLADDRAMMPRSEGLPDCAEQDVVRRHVVAVNHLVLIITCCYDKYCGAV
jgi:hypothetical protein